MAKKQSPLDKLLGRNKPEAESLPEPVQFEPEHEQEEPEFEEFMEIGGSPDGCYMRSRSGDQTICITV